jgi:uncharacterized protein (TIGR03437 family)
MRLLVATSLFTLAATAQPLPLAVDQVQRIDKLYPWLNVLAFDVDAQNNIYLSGSSLGPVPNVVNIRYGPLGGTDIVVIKIDPAGQLIYGAAIGGTKDEYVSRIKADSGGSLYLAGSTNSVDYPALWSQTPFGDGAVVLKLDPTGNMLYDTRLNWAGAILTMSLDTTGILYIGGVPKPGQLPVTPGAYRQSAEDSGGFIARLEREGKELESATYIEGQVRNVVSSGTGDVVFSMGKTIAALDASLSRLSFSTLTDLDTDIVHVAIDGSSNVYVTAPDAVRKFAPDGRRLLWARDFARESLSQFTVTPWGTAVMTGRVPLDFPTHHGSQACGGNLFEPVSAGATTTNGFLMVIGPDGDTRYATFLAEDIPAFLPFALSAADGRPYALGQAFLVLDGRLVRWLGILRFDVNHLPAEHTQAGCLLNSATMLQSPIAPGTRMTLVGEQLGPEAGVSFALQDGHAPFDIAGASITVDGKPAPVLYAQERQINFVVPWSVRMDGARVPVCITMNTVDSCLYAATAPVAPGLFTINGQIAAVNPDGTINSPQHPAPSGSYVSVYMTGGGQIQGPMVDGGVAGFDLQRIVAADAAVFTASRCGPGACVDQTLDAHILFDGAVPTLVYGVYVVVVDVPTFFSPFGSQSAKFTFALRATPQGAVSMVSGFLYIR